ncbi:hypothetical protein WL29_22170 [Burkholderia ubonensis]|uniref:Type II/III secretion system secretin-like domain-containing protein n=1 Tax=Burkholderia ubonensis TaxID=101571 RepID=A0A125DMD9_9BURK|nr:hypothetical protein [Burkholderia ubonensis]KWA84075.1 hypothetical protein WL29_22170 [Burkholderia ubonensis]
MKKLTLALLISSALAGCASFPDHYDKPIGTQDIQAQKRDEWSNLPAVTFVQSNAGVSVRKFNQIPDVVRAKPIKLDFDRVASATLNDVVFAMGQQGFRLVSRLGDNTLKQAWTLRTNAATVGEVLDDIGATYNIATEYRNGSVYLVESNKYSASLPQHKEFLDNVVKGLKDMGATDVRADMLSGLVYYNAKPEVATYLEEYLNTISKNAAMVTLQVAVLTVGVDREINLGFDWAKSAVMRGSGGMRSDLSSIFDSSNGNSNNGGLSNGTNGSNGSTGNTGSNGSNSNGTNNNGSSSLGNAVNDVTNAATSTAKQLVKGSLLSFAGAQGFGFKFANDAFSLTAALKALSTYGNARTEQNVLLGTLSGMPVKINSGDDIPYVKSIGSTTASGGSTQGSSQTDIIKSGLKLEVIPNFDASDGTVMATVKVDMSTLVGFRELSAGTNLGTMSQPQMKNLGFENVGRLNAGETIIVGGITYDQLSNNYTNFPGMEKVPLGSKAEKVTRNAMYIVVRPTVVIFTPKANELNAKLHALQMADKPATNPDAIAGEAE